MVEEVVIRSRSSDEFVAVRAEPWNDDAPEYYEGPDVTVELKVGGLHAVTVLPAYIADAERLGPFFHEIDRDWRGWIGAKTAGVEGEAWLWLSATHDGSGHVAMTVGVSSGWPMDLGWLARGTLYMDVGSFASFASAMDAWFETVWPPQHRWRSPA